jgi:DNA-binding GntR family transcriptional regulator
MSTAHGEAPVARSPTADMSTDDTPSARGLSMAVTPTLADAVSDALRDAILAGRFTPGARLVEANIARELRVSRGSVREALAVLANEGLVVTLPRHGKFVQPLDATTIDEVYSLRTVLEPFAVERVIARLEDEARLRLRRAFAAIGEAVKTGDIVVVAHRDIAFHEEIFLLADHGRLRRVWTDIRGTLQLMFNVTTATHLSLDEALDQHRPILEAVLAGDAVTARTLVDEHIRAAWERAHTAMLGRDPAVEA